jgi:hypothetical protein
MPPRRVLVVACAAGACALGAPATPASAFNPVKPICGVAGFVSGIAGKACSAAQNAGRVVGAGKRLATGHLGGAVKALTGGSAAGGAASSATTALGLAAIGAWVLGGANFALHETATVLSRTTNPQLATTWFSSTYWRMAGIAAVLTLPFLFAAAVQALLRSDLALLVRSTLGYLPLAMLAISVAAPVTMLLLAASDQLSGVVASAAGNAGVHFLVKAGAVLGALTVVTHSPFIAFLIGLLTVAGAIVLWLELLMREAAVYVIVLMLPLAFAALVWPARRIWAIRAVELLVALILSKFAIVAVLSLGGAAMSAGTGTFGLTALLAGVVLLVMGVFTPWALLRLLPLAELASGAVGSLRGQTAAARPSYELADGVAQKAHEWAVVRTAEMRREAVDPGSRRATEVGQEATVEGPSETDARRREGRGEPGAEGRSEPGTEGRAEPGAGSRVEPEPDRTPEDRLPGLPAIFQQEDGAWNPIVLGLGDGKPQRVWPPEEDSGL